MRKIALSLEYWEAGRFLSWVIRTPFFKIWLTYSAYSSQKIWIKGKALITGHARYDSEFEELYVYHLHWLKQAWRSNG